MDYKSNNKKIGKRGKKHTHTKKYIFKRRINPKLESCVGKRWKRPRIRTRNNQEDKDHERKQRTRREGIYTPLTKNAYWKEGYNQNGDPAWGKDGKDHAGGQQVIQKKKTTQEDQEQSKRIITVLILLTYSCTKIFKNIFVQILYLEL